MSAIGKALFTKFQEWYSPLDEETLHNELAGYRAEAVAHIKENFRTKSEKLDLCSFGLSSLPKCLGRFSHLREIDLNGNQFREFPPEITPLRNLKVLKLSENRLYGFPLEVLQFKSLVELNISGNEIGSLPQEINQLTRLEIFHAVGTGLTFLPSEICALPLKKLRVNLNQLHSLPLEIGNLHSLRSLDIEMNHLRELPDSLARLAKDCPVYAFHNLFSGKAVSDIRSAIIVQRQQTEELGPSLSIEVYDPPLFTPPYHPRDLRDLA
ncbi:MAG TPA: leucine-rich repeat domain-containing protein [Chlamydiales bacterium]|nr:leucine-rich repeat domain-containing protein [Chlamydiales bacterium]